MSSDKIKDTNIVEEMNNSFLDYAMSVIVSRALPDVRDGLKPVHRRILYAMNDLGNTPDKAYKKSARIVGDVIGKYHPHGDTSVYDAMVRMSQEFSFREPLVDGHGNFGSLDGDGAAAMRYTEARMSKLAMELLRDINKKTIDYQDNYDGSEREPVVMPARFPNLLVNGASGIAVGMATNIPPHNLGEVIDATIAYMDNNDIDLNEIMSHIKGPDFPLGGEILGNVGIKKAYETGNGSIKVRSKYECFTDSKGRSTIIVSEIPFQVNKANLVEKIADCVKDKRVEGISDLRDESDRDGVRVVIELSRNVSPEVVMNGLFKYTQLESSFAMNMLALVNGEPKVLPIKSILQHYVEHQVEVTERKTKFELEKAKARAHILEGLKIALDHIDAVISVIRGSQTQEIAFNQLRESFGLSEIQAKAILEMQLRRLTGLEHDKLVSELSDLLVLISDLENILNDKSRVLEIIRESLLEVKARFESPRRSVIIEGYFDSSIDYEQLIEESDVIISLTRSGYIKRLSPENYRAQARGGKGTKGMNVNAEDVVTNILSASTHSDLLFFTDLGNVFKTRTHRVPEYSKTAKGLPLVNLIDIGDEEKITKIISLKDYEDDASLMIITKKGFGKKTLLKEYIRIQKNGKRAITLKENDAVQSIFVVRENEEIIIATKQAKALRCVASNFRPLGRTSQGSIALRLNEEDYIVAADVVNSGDYIVSITENAIGKATSVNDFRLQARGGKGIRCLNIDEKSGPIIASFKLRENEFLNKDILMMTDLGQAIRINASAIKIQGRVTKGVRLMKTAESDRIANVEIVGGFEKEENENEE